MELWKYHESPIDAWFRLDWRYQYNTMSQYELDRYCKNKVNCVLVLPEENYIVRKFGILRNCEWGDPHEAPCVVVIFEITVLFQLIYFFRMKELVFMAMVQLQPSLSLLLLYMWETSFILLPHPAPKFMKRLYSFFHSPVVLLRFQYLLLWFGLLVLGIFCGFTTL